MKYQIAPRGPSFPQFGRTTLSSHFAHSVSPVVTFPVYVAALPPPLLSALQNTTCPLDSPSLVKRVVCVAVLQVQSLEMPRQHGTFCIWISMKYWNT